MTSNHLMPIIKSSPRSMVNNKNDYLFIVMTCISFAFLILATNQMISETSCLTNDEQHIKNFMSFFHYNYPDFVFDEKNITSIKLISRYDMKSRYDCFELSGKFTMTPKQYQMIKKDDFEQLTNLLCVPESH